MKLQTWEGNLRDLETDLVLLVLDEQNQLFDLGEDESDQALRSRVAGVGERFTAGELTREFSFDGAGGESRVGGYLVYSSAQEKNYAFWESLKTFVARALRFAVDTGRRSLTVALNGPAGAEQVARVVEGALLGCYSFSKYKQGARDRFEDFQLTLWVPEGGGEAAEAAVERSRVFSEATNAARDLVNEPGAVCTPAALVRRAQEIAAAHGMGFEDWDHDRLVQERCVGLVNVGGAARHQPHMVTISYQPAEANPDNVHLVLIGKGVTFDSGGISIKGADKMHIMRGDMAGAAAVLGAMDIIGQLKPSIHVTGIVVTSENAIDANAFRPGDILVYKNGKSVHVENTDAEGRLILADGLIRAGELGATHIVDIATLTGACPRALGYSFSGLMGTHRGLVNGVTRAGSEHGEAFWKLPLPAEYKEYIKSDVADVNNMGGPAAGTITAGLFLQEFVPGKTPWAHLDIASTFWKQKPWKYFGEGPSGVGARTLAELALNWVELTAR